MADALMNLKLIELLRMTNTVIKKPSGCTPGRTCCTAAGLGRETA